MLKPNYRRQPGRPKKMRKLEHDELIPPNSTNMRRFYVNSRLSECGKRDIILEHNKRQRRAQDASSQPTGGASRVGDESNELGQGASMQAANELLLILEEHLGLEEV
ncbi:hypothetical protein L484_003298 [Morus notabilis]|uniref:Uncharacterized protein n=1 Tax=Morus notabilis TaxID=981085 RepID=W9R0K6_9ROSA|nr:hypothetical protein L484_003298 [Morus notabilis]